MQQKPSVWHSQAPFFSSNGTNQVSFVPFAGPVLKHSSVSGKDVRAMLCKRFLKRKPGLEPKPSQSFLGNQLIPGGGGATPQGIWCVLDAQPCLACFKVPFLLCQTGIIGTLFRIGPLSQFCPASSDVFVSAMFWTQFSSQRPCTKSDILFYSRQEI